MKTIKLLALTSAAALLAACGTAGESWKEVSQEKFLEEVCAVEDYQYAKAHVTGTAHTVTTTSGSGEQLEAALSAMQMSLGTTEEDMDIDLSFTYTDEGWVNDDPEAEESGLNANQVLVQMNHMEAYEKILPAEDSEETTEEDSEATPVIDIKPTLKFYSGKGWKIYQEIEGVGKSTSIMDEKAYMVSTDSDITMSMSQDLSAYGMDAVLEVTVRSISNIKIAYSGEYTALEATAA